MANKKRLLYLFDRELDGELSAIEKDELERLVRIEPEKRRERVAWQRVAEAIGEDAAKTPKLDVARVSARVLNGRGRKLSVRGGWLGLFSPRMLLAASTAMAIAGLILLTKRVEPPRHDRVREAVVAKPPVDVFFGDESIEDDRAALAEIKL